MENPLLEQLILFAILSLIGWIYLCLGIRDYIDAGERRKRETAQTTGTVVDYVKRQWRHRRRGRHRTVTCWIPVVEFRAGDQPCRLQCPGGAGHREASVGETVEVFYDPGDPSRFHLKTHMVRDFRSAVGLAVAGVGWIILSAIIVMKSL